jgi:hypothetical protein
MNMKYIITIIKRIFPKELPKPVGRWRIENCNKQMNSKIDLSNEDHCGPCGQYALTKIENDDNDDNKSKKTETKNIQSEKSK